ncbi:LysR family transcriptional regulator, partial [Aquisphaera insulae]|uniref:LysR family transcriptional regulator n=1 Tax=Aquisphaera insulae TaxID=2712864 RepID=UPI0013E99FD1
MIRKFVHSAARSHSFDEAAEAVADLAEVEISGRQLGRIAHETGAQLRARRDERVERFRAGTSRPQVATRPALAVVEVDGGRLLIRGEGEGPGAHDAAWREDKIAILATMSRSTSASDPEPELPPCFRDRAFVEKVIGGIGGTGPMGPPTPDASVPPPPPPAGPPQPRTRPELMVRTYVATTAPVDRFGPMVAAEAHRRNFAEAAAGAFLGDGSAWVWGLHRRHLPSFVAIVDFLHALSHLFTAARAMAADTEGRWELFLAWEEACWKGRVDQVIAELSAWRDIQSGLIAGGLDELPVEDPRRVVARVANYLEDNRERMDYPRYRCEGLPWTTSHIESTVKIFNRRVKGTEKSWNDAGGETILELRAAFLSEDGRLDRHMKEQPSSPYRNYKTRRT